MEITLQTILNFGAGILLTIVGFFMREGWKLVRDMQEEIKQNRNNSQTDIHEVRELIANEYVKKDDVQRGFDKIDANLAKILDKLDEKADK